MSDETLQFSISALARAEADATPSFARVLAVGRRARRPRLGVALAIGAVAIGFLVMRPGRDAPADPLLSTTPEFSAALRLARDLTDNVSGPTR